MKAPTLQRRLALLLAGVLAAAVVLTALVIGSATRDRNAEFAARTLHAHVRAADASLAGARAGEARPRLQALGYAWRMQPPAPQRPLLPLMHEAERRLRARLGGRRVVMSGVPAWLWVEAPSPHEGWIGIPALGEAMPFHFGLVLSLVLVGGVVLVAAALFTRSLVRPLDSLARAAPRIVAGDPAPAPPAGATREVIALYGALDAASRQARTQARERELMLAGLSHDMRTPLARLRYALALDDAEARAGMEQDIDALEAMTERFIAYVRDGSEEPPARVHLVDAVAGALRAVAGADVRWSTDLPAEAPVIGRPQALARAVANLLQNAVRHGAPPFAVRLAREGREWVITVSDTGAGVDPDLLTELGRPFFRADAARTGAPGSGLGLASVARVAAVHGGRLELRNRSPRGFEASLRLPAAD